jgi:ATP-dependent Clp protease ATP-binding subunit ClpA
VRVLAEAVEDAVRLSRRYIPSRQLPDKAVSLLDTACGRVAIASHAIPAPVEDRRRRIEMLDVDLAVLAREGRIGTDHSQRVGEINTDREKTAKELADLEAQWEKERDLVGRIRALHDALGDPELGAEPAEGAEDPDKLRADLAACNAELTALQGEKPLMHVTVDSQAIAEVVGNWTGIPVGRMVSNEIKTVLALKDKLEERVIGQPHALDAIAETIRTSRAKLIDPRKPIGVFLMVGTSDVGKTETALAVADLLYGACDCVVSAGPHQQHRFGSGQVDVGRHQRHPLRGVHQGGVGLHLTEQHLMHRHRQLVRVLAQRKGQAALRVEVDEQHSPSRVHHRRTQRGHRRRFGHPALLVGHGQHTGRHKAPLLHIVGG